MHHSISGVKHPKNSVFLRERLNEDNSPPIFHGPGSEVPGCLSLMSRDTYYRNTTLPTAIFELMFMTHVIWNAWFD